MLSGTCIPGLSVLCMLSFCHARIRWPMPDDTRCGVLGPLLGSCVLTLNNPTCRTGVLLVRRRKDDLVNQGIQTSKLQ